MRHFIISALFVASSFGTTWATARASDAPTSSEVMMVELINRARANPSAEATLYGIELNEGVPSEKTISTDPKQPLAINPMLVTAARLHSADMITRSFFSHTNPDGLNPGDRITAAGYTWWTYGENIAKNSSSSTVAMNQPTAEYHHKLLFVDENIEGRGHRTNIENTNVREIGVGFATGVTNGYNAVSSTTNFGTQATTTGGDTQVRICGVIILDADNDQFYDVGEGLSGATITVQETGDTVQAWDAGAYTLPFTGTAGTYTLTITFTNNNTIKSQTIVVGTNNIKADFIFTSSDTTPDTEQPQLVFSCPDTTLTVGDTYEINLALTGTVPENCDLYIAVKLQGTFFFYPAFTDVAAPAIRSVSAGSGNIMTMTVDEAMAASFRGQTLTWYALVYDSQFKEISNVATLPTTFE